MTDLVKQAWARVKEKLDAVQRHSEPFEAVWQAIGEFESVATSLERGSVAESVALAVPAGRTMAHKMAEDADALRR